MRPGRVPPARADPGKHLFSPAKARENANECAFSNKKPPFYHENGGFLHFLRRKQYGSIPLTHIVTHTRVLYNGQGSTKEYLMAAKTEKSEKLLKKAMKIFLP